MEENKEVQTYAYETIQDSEKLFEIKKQELKELNLERAQSEINPYRWVG